MAEKDIQREHYEVLMRLAKSKLWGYGDLETILSQVTEAAARVMSIQRVNVWLFDEQRTKISCVENFDQTTGEHTRGFEIAAADYPTYFKALHDERTIVADNARTDPRTREFTDCYLDVYGITSMLDAPLHADGEVIGIVCHEHVGPPRVWTPEEQRFAASLADLASIAFESRERKLAEASLRESEKLTREIITHALDAIVISNDHGVITNWNPRAEAVFGWTREEAVGKTLFETVIPERYHDDHRRGMERYLETGQGTIINQRIEIAARNKEGREFPVELTVSPVHIGESLAFSAFVRDITDRVRAEQEVTELNTELEARVQKRTQELRAAVLEKERLLEELQSSSVELVDRLYELEQKSETIRNDLDRAQVIQRALLPAHPPRLDGIHVNALYRPGMKVGGDLYDVAVLDDNHVALYIADAAGHGVAAAMLSVLFKQRLQMRDTAGAPLTPSEVLRRVNARLFDDVLSQGLFLTVGYILLNTNTGELSAASAGHTPIVLRHSGRPASAEEPEVLHRTGPALGLVKDATFTEHRHLLEQGDRLMLCTDGLIDGLEPSHADGIVEFMSPALMGASADAPQRLRRLFQDATQRANGSSNGDRDDVTLLVLETSHGASSFDNGELDERFAGATTARSTEEVAANPPEAHSISTPILWIAESERETHLAVRGQGRWSQCETFRRLGRASLDAGRSLTIDLSDCTYLDSAFLGTLHEVVVSNDPGRMSVRSPCEAVRGLFAELGLESVIGSIQEEPVAPPCEPAPVSQDAPAGECQQRLLRAHEILSELSEENHERFARVVQALRADLRRGSNGR